MKRHYLVVSFLALILAVGIYKIANFNFCETDVARVIPAPDGIRNLVIFHRDCGATVDFNTQASLVPVNRTFSFDRYPAFVSVSGNVLAVRWLGDGGIGVSLPCGEKIFRQARQSDGVTVTYGWRQ